MNGFNWLRKLLKSEHGNVIVIAAATMPLMVGAGAVALDTIQLSLWKRQLQRAADSGALAGARALAQQKSATAAVDRDLQLNNQVPLTATRVVENAPTVGAYAGNALAVRVVLTSQQRLPFWQFFTNSAPTLRVSATAARVRDGAFCMVSLEEGNVAGIDVGGNATLNLGCGMATNSRAAEAITARGSARITSNPITAVGGLTRSDHFTGATEFNGYATEQQDPFARLPDPVVPPGPCPSLTVQPNETETIAPGCYSGMDLKGNVTLQPGTYFVNGGSFDASSQAVITCNGCTIILSSSTAANNPSSIASLQINGGAELNMTAPASGPYAGVLFYQDRRAPLLNTMRINGHASGVMEGALYLPRANLTMNGASAMNTQCFQLVARRLTFTGSMNIQNNCPPGGASRAFAADYVRLVE
jgi:Flp pilus assembly protein TadG